MKAERSDVIIFSVESATRGAATLVTSAPCVVIEDEFIHAVFVSRIVWKIHDKSIIFGRVFC